MARPIVAIPPVLRIHLSTLRLIADWRIPRIMGHSHREIDIGRIPNSPPRVYGEEETLREIRIPNSPPPVLRGERNSQRNTNSEFSPGFTGREKETLREIRILNSPPVLRGEKETLREIRILNSPPVLQGERNSQRTHLEEF